MTRLIFVVAVAGVTSIGCASASRARPNACLPDTAEYIVTFRRLLIDNLAGRTEDDSLFRVGADLPPANAPDVEIVTSDAVCRQAAAALATASRTGSPSDATWVIRVKTMRYLVFNLNQHSAGRTLGFVFDSRFRYRTTIIL